MYTRINDFGVVILIMLFKTQFYLLFSETTKTEKASNPPIRWKTTRTIDPIPRWKGSLPNMDVVYEPIEIVNRFLDDELLSSQNSTFTVIFIN